MEIGGNFLIEENLVEPNDTLDCFLKQFAQNKVYFDSGRSAIRFLCGLSNKKMVLLPNFLCDSMIQPFIEEDFNIIFYEIDANLEPIINSIKVDESVGIFIHLGYFGKRSSEKLQDTIILLKSLGTIVVEDITHSIFSKTVISMESDYYVCSIRKWLGISDGGILLSNRELDFVEGTTNTELQKNYSEGSKFKKFKIINETYDTSHLDYFRQAEESLNQSNKTFLMSSLSKNILHRYDFKRMIYIRLENSQYLLREIVKLGFKTLEFDFDLTTPIFIPIFFNNREERDLYKLQLVNSKIYTPVHWPKPRYSSINNSINNSMYDLELSIPCDQRYSVDDMKRIITEIERIMEIAND